MAKKKKVRSKARTPRTTKKCDCIIMPATLPKTLETGLDAVDRMWRLLGADDGNYSDELYELAPNIIGLYVNTVRKYYDPYYPGYNADPEAKLSDLWLTDFMHFAASMPKIRNAPPETKVELAWITERIGADKASLQ